MTLVETINKLVDWVATEVCPEIQLKLPDDYKNDEGYDVEYVNPAAFPLYLPAKDRLPPDVAAPIPSICVQIMEGSDDLTKETRQLQIRLCLACWNPGTHDASKVYPQKNEEAVGGYSYFYKPEQAQAYTRHMNGWKDSYNLTDLTLRKLEGCEYLNGLRVVKEAGIKFGPFTEDGNIWDYYPYWHSWISFTVEAGVVHKTPGNYEKYL